MMLARSLFVLFLACFGCNRSERSPSAAPASMSQEQEPIRLDYQGEGEVHLTGSVTQGEGRRVAWRVPGDMHIRGEVPFAGPAPEMVRISLQFDSKDAKGTTVGAKVAKPIVQDGKLTFDVDMNAYASWKPIGPVSLVVKNMDDDAPIASLPLDLDFVAK